MTEKRFTLTKGFDEHERQIRDNGRIIMGCFHEVQAKPIVDLLNNLHEDLEREKQKNRALRSVLGCTKIRLKKICEELE